MQDEKSAYISTLHTLTYDRHHQLACLTLAVELLGWVWIMLSVLRLAYCKTAKHIHTVPQRLFVTDCYLRIN